jgi:hypothetical protein
MARSSKWRWILAMVGAAFLVAGSLPAAPPATRGNSTLGQPASWPMPNGAAEVEGFGDTKFGMRRADVITSITAKYGTEVARGLTPEKVEPGFTALSTSLPTLTIVGAARALYVFDAGDRLAAVNLTWQSGVQATAAEREKLVATAGEFTASFLAHSWRPLDTVRGKVLGDNQVIVFAAGDAAGAGVEVRLLGVDLVEKLPDGTERASPPAQGPAVLRVLFSADIDHRKFMQRGDLLPDAPEGSPYRIPGFRSAMFGMTIGDVVKAAEHDLGVPEARMHKFFYAPEQTTMLVADVVRLDPGPAAAAVTYIFGAKSHRLVRVNVVWTFPDEPAAYQRRALVETGYRLAGHLRSLPVQPPGSDSGEAAVGPNSLRFYKAVDSSGASIEMIADGVAFDHVLAGKTVAGPVPIGPATLRIAYALDEAHPDNALRPQSSFGHIKRAQKIFPIRWYF